MIENSTVERLLAAILVVVCLGLAGFELRSDIAARRGSDRPVLAWLNLRSSGGSSLKSPAYFLSYSWKYRTLHVMYITPSISPDSVKALLTQMGGDPFSLDWETDRVPDSAAPERIKDWISGWPHDLRFWLRLPRTIRTVRSRIRPALSIYDALLLSLEIYRFRLASIHLIWLTQLHTIPRLTGILLGNAASEEETSPLTVEIRNASGESGVALRATKILRWEGFDVLEFGNASEAESDSRFFDRTGDIEAAARVASGLGCPRAEALTQIEADRHVMVTAVLGRDFQSCTRLSEADAQGIPGSLLGRIKLKWRQ